MLSAEDLTRLEQAKLDRFRQTFGEPLTQATLYITLDNCLVIPCLSQAQVQCLQQEEEALRHFSWLILGVDGVALYLDQQCVWAMPTRALPVQVTLTDSPLILEANTDV